MLAALHDRLRRMLETSDNLKRNINNQITTKSCVFFSYLYLIRHFQQEPLQASRRLDEAFQYRRNGPREIFLCDKKCRRRRKEETWKFLNWIEQFYDRCVHHLLYVASMLRARYKLGRVRENFTQTFSILGRIKFWFHFRENSDDFLGCSYASWRGWFTASTK